MQVIEVDAHTDLLNVWKTNPAGTRDLEFMIKWKQIEA